MKITLSRSVGSSAHAGFARWGALAATLFFVVLSLGPLWAQEHKAPAQQPAAAQQQTSEEAKPAVQGEHQAGEAQASEAAGEAAEAKGKEERKADSQEKMVEELKHSPSVQWMSKLLHISPEVGYWVGIIFDFGILALLIIVALKKTLPTAFSNRTATIRRGIDEARKASEEAGQRLAAIEARLAKLGDEVAAMRAAAEQEAAAEEQRVLAAAEDDKKRIVQAAESEIAAAAKLARRELKAYAADLAVTLAERRIRVDANTDRALVRSFTEQLGGEAGNGGPGKDGN